MKHFSTTVIKRWKQLDQITDRGGFVKRQQCQKSNRLQRIRESRMGSLWIPPLSPLIATGGLTTVEATQCKQHFRCQLFTLMTLLYKVSK